MWSKQADVRNSANMTSFKNKITNRKQKNNTAVAAAGSNSQQQSMADNTNNKLVQNNGETEASTLSPPRNNNKSNKSSKHRNRGGGSSSKKVIEKKKKEVNNAEDGGGGSSGKVDDIIAAEPVETETNEMVVDVVLRNNLTMSEELLRNNANLNRYSDSFVIESGDGGLMTRTVSGFLLPEELSNDKAAARKSRRFSDLFRHGALKSTNSMENINLKQAENGGATSNKKSLINKTANDNKANKQKKNDTNPKTQNSNNNSSSKEMKNAKNYEKSTAAITKQSENNSNSYLKRVKSKIYKTKSDEGVLPSKTTISTKNKSKVCDRIPEDAVVTGTLPLEFRLIRQTSNLEQLYNKMKSAWNSGNDHLPKPVLQKAKSSSAINLNLLRARRSKMLEQLKDKRCKDVFDEFEFIAFGGFKDKFGGSQKIFSSTADVIHEGEVVKDYPDLGDNKPSQPVTRSGSDRRPDVVREELHKNPEGTVTDHGHEKPENDSNAEGAASFPSAAHKKRASSNINRSESVKEQTEKQRKQRRNHSDPSHNTTSGDVELDQPGLSNTDSGSSSNSSISYNGRLSESPSNSADAVVTDGGKKTGSDWESDIEMEPDWSKLVTEEEIRNLQPQEKKRQDIINELFHTEGSHVRNLKVLYEIFYKTLLENQILKPDELSLIFPNIEELFSVHKQLNKEMKKKRREGLVGNLGDMLVNMFGGGTGESLQRAAATFCERQQLALEFIKERRKRDSKFDSVLMECEKKKQCRRLPLQGIIPTEMQRLSKYPLLLERLISNLEKDSTEKGQEEFLKLRRAHNSSKEILNYVNEAAKLALNRARLEDIQRHLDTSNFERSEHPITQEFRNMDLTRYKLIMEGNMQLRRPNKGIVPVHILLLEEAVVILHKEGDRFLLKFFQSGSPAQPQPLSPVIKMSTLLVRNNAVCKNALFLVNTSTTNSQMYDLLAEDDAKRDLWFKHFSDAANVYNRREGQPRRPDPTPDSDESETVQELPQAKEERAETVEGAPPTRSSDGSDVNETGIEDGIPPSDGEGDGKEDNEIALSSDGGGIQTRVRADDWPLIQPSQVHIETPPVHTAESRLTPLEQIRRKDEEVRRALEDKEGLVADLLSIPREHFQVIADMAGDTQETQSRDLAERVMAAVYQVNQLHLAVNDALNVTEAAAVAATGGKHPGCQSQEMVATAEPPSIPAHQVKEIANLLSSQLTTLLSDVKHVEEERDMLRKELHRMREKLHEQQMLHGPDEQTPSTPPPETQDLESIKESPTESES